MASTGVTRIFHVLVFLFQSFAVYYDLVYVDAHIPKRSKRHMFGGRLKYMTFINMILLAIYFGLSVLSDLFAHDPPRSSQQPHHHTGASKVKTIRDTVYASLAFPISTVVVLMFWGIYSIDRELVYPKVLDEIIPTWLNHVMHTTPILFLILEQSLVCHEYPRRIRGMLITCSFSALYISWLLYIKYEVDIWAYPILEVLTPVQTSVFLCSSLLLTGSFYLLGELIHNITWARQGVVSKKVW